MNYCTFFPEGNWSECCRRHDRRYENKRLTKRQADILLKRCVTRKAGCLIGWIIYLGVRLPIIAKWFYSNAQSNTKGKI